jgi:hypothetical protein
MDSIIRIDREHAPLFLVADHVTWFAFELGVTLIGVANSTDLLRVPGDHTNRLCEAIDVWRHMQLSVQP